jgi:hypothetical protein
MLIHDHLLYVQNHGFSYLYIDFHDFRLLIISLYVTNKVDRLLQSHVFEASVWSLSGWWGYTLNLMCSPMLWVLVSQLVAAPHSVA